MRVLEWVFGEDPLLIFEKYEVLYYNKMNGVNP